MALNNPFMRENRAGLKQGLPGRQKSASRLTLADDLGLRCSR